MQNRDYEKNNKNPKKDQIHKRPNTRKQSEKTYKKHSVNNFINNMIKNGRLKENMKKKEQNQYRV